MELSDSLAAHALMQVQGTSNRHPCHETVIEHPKLYSKLIHAVYENAKHKEHPELEHALFRRVSEELGYTRMSGIDRTAWYEVFVKVESKCKYLSAPSVIIAVRGTELRSLTDWGSNLRVVTQSLKGDKRHGHLKELVGNLVRRFSHTKVTIAGHSLGAAFALLVGKAMAKAKTPIEAYLFNPPFPSFDFICSPSLRKLEKGCKLMLLGTYMLLGAIFSDEISERHVFTRVRDYLVKWTPHLFVNKGDFICWGHVNQIKDKLAFGDKGFMARLAKWVAPHTMLSLLFKGVSPHHLLPSAKVTIADSYASPLKSHGLDQWFQDPEWKSGSEVKVLAFGRQLAQPKYSIQQGYFTLKCEDCDDVKLMLYDQTTGSRVAQFFWTMGTGGLGTSKQKQLMFMFNTEQDAEVVGSMWPKKLSYRDINDCIQQAMSFEFLLHKSKKGAITFYIYAVKRKQVPFEREVEWTYVLDYFNTKVCDKRDWMKIVRTAVWAGILL